MNSTAKEKELKDIAISFGVGNLKSHIFLCRGPHCVSIEKGEKTWEFLKNRLKQLSPSDQQNIICRSKVDCLRICQKGPIALVYPGGAWYDQVDEKKMEQIIQYHCFKNEAQKPEPFISNPLSD